MDLLNQENYDSMVDAGIWSCTLEEKDSVIYALCFHQAIVKVIKSSLEWSKDSMYHGCNRDIPRPYGNLLCEVNESHNTRYYLFHMGNNYFMCSTGTI